MGAMTSDADEDRAEPRRDALLPADPAKYDDPRNVAARRRGLEQPYIAGGDDPELPETLRREGRQTRLLVLMAIVLLGFVLGILQALLGLGG